MVPKVQFHLMGWITLVIFPAPALWALWKYADIHPWEVLALDQLSDPIVLVGLQFGVFYALLAIAVSQFSVFEEISVRQAQLLSQLQLNWWDIVFISFCAGFGEEILFRAGIQHWLGPWLTSIIFIAVHGYFHPLSWRKSLYGFLVLPFIVLLAFAYDFFGLWFCIAAHFSYDLLLFRVFAFQKKR
jgi:membrane protease YdiL (CAAX protease family)